MLLLQDPLPADLTDAVAGSEKVSVLTSTERDVDDELRALGYEVLWRPHLDAGAPEDEQVKSLYNARKVEARKPAKVFVCRFPYGNSESPDVSDWLLATLPEILSDPRVEDYRVARIDDTPVSMTRNAAARAAMDWGADVLLLLDNDMRPDYLLRDDADDPAVKPFWKTAFDFWWSHPGACMVGAPYCCGGVVEEPLVFRWSAKRSPDEGHGYKIQRYGRDECQHLSGVQRVGALPTGLLLVDTKVFAQMPMPWFYYEYVDESCTEKASTEDVTFTRDAVMQGIPIYCAWDCWAGHWKRKLVGKPESVNIASVPHKFRKATLNSILRSARANSPSVEADLMTATSGAVASV